MSLCRTSEADEPAAVADADMDELDRYAAGVEREEVQPSGVAAAAALGMVDEVTPPPKKKQRRITKTELRRVEIRTLLNAGLSLPQIAKQLDCDRRTIQGVMTKMKQESEEERRKSYQATSRVLAVTTGNRGRPPKITPGL